MATREERLLILKMIQEKKITAGEGAQLLDALEERRGTDATSPGEGAEKQPGSTPRWVRVRVTDAATGRGRLNLRLPTALVARGIKVGTRITPQIGVLDTDQILQAIRAGETGEIIDVVDNESGEHVEVFLE